MRYIALALVLVFSFVSFGNASINHKPIAQEIGFASVDLADVSLDSVKVFQDFDLQKEEVLFASHKMLTSIQVEKVKQYVKNNIVSTIKAGSLYNKGGGVFIRTPT